MGKIRSLDSDLIVFFKVNISRVCSCCSFRNASVSVTRRGLIVACRDLPNIDLKIEAESKG